MAIPESQLETWSHQGSVTQSAQTYDAIQKVLNDSSSPYFPRDFSVFLQGSYGNSTNVYRDSDVDIVIRLNQTFYSDLSNLEVAAKAGFDAAYPDAPYGFDEFKTDVLSWLTSKFGSAVQPGKKAIFIKGNYGRRDADVLVCAKLRRYREGSTGTDFQYDEGICFFLPDRTRIVNFPQQHAANCTTKNQATDHWFKKTVRVYKNMRNRMLDEGYIADDIAPSYFVEGMLWNVPDGHFGRSFGGSFVNSFNWIEQADATKLACANDFYWLVRENAHNCWPSANFAKYLVATKRFWNDWGS